MIITYLKITSFLGAINSEHYYGRLERRGLVIELDYEISEAEARKLNKKDGYSSYKPGDRSQRWYSEDDIIAYAKELCPGQVLILGDPCYCDPQPILAGPPDVMEAGNKLYQQAEAVGFWEGDPTAMRKICDEWDLLMK